MVYYGPWRQSADYERSVFRASIDQAGDGLTTRWAYAFTEEILATTGTPAEQGTVDSVAGSVAEQAGEVDPGSPALRPAGSLRTGLSRFTTGSPPVQHVRYEAISQHAPLAFSTWGNPGAADAAIPLAIPAAQWPAGAVSYERETGLSTAIRAVLHLEWENRDFDETVNPPVVPAGDYVHQLRSTTGSFSAWTAPYRRDRLVSWGGGSGPVLLEIPRVTPGQHVPTDLDCTPEMFGNPEDGFVVLAHTMRLLTLPPITDLMADHQLGYSIGGLSADNVAMTYTLRPPRHRFVFERAPSPPITRVHPRDDGRGTAAAARVWPPARSQQGGSRVGPGSYR